MSYYKLIQGSEIIDAINGSSAVWLVENPRSLSIFTGTEESAKGVLSSDGVSYHIRGRDPFTDYPNMPEIILEEISESEYLLFREELDAGRLPVDTDPVIEPDDVRPDDTAAKTRIAAIEEQIEGLTESNAMLTECLLEMSEIVYG